MWEPQPFLDRVRSHFRRRPAAMPPKGKAKAKPKAKPKAKVKAKAKAKVNAKAKAKAKAMAPAARMRARIADLTTARDVLTMHNQELLREMDNMVRENQRMVQAHAKAVARARGYPARLMQRRLVLAAVRAAKLAAAAVPILVQRRAMNAARVAAEHALEQGDSQARVAAAGEAAATAHIAAHRGGAGAFMLPGGMLPPNQQNALLLGLGVVVNTPPAGAADPALQAVVPVRRGGGVRMVLQPVTPAVIAL